MEAGNGVLQVTDCVSHPQGRILPRPIRFSDISDGLSQTMLVCEARYTDADTCDICDRFALYHPEFDRGRGDDFSEVLASLRDGINLKGTSKERLELSIGSHHPGGVNTVWCDGAVRFLSQSIDEQVRQAVGSRDGREVFDQSAL